MSRFNIKQFIDFEENPFDRHSRMEWWSQEKVSQAKVMVVGAGAVGNETLKNLALLGVKNIFIVDFDDISTSNLSRTVLFRKSDKGKCKAKTAAMRVKKLCLAEDVRIDWFHGDIVWDLGTGVYREMDLVLGCLDNVETRFHVNRQCYLSQTPWIDAGIYELGLSVTAFTPPNAPCYECNASSQTLNAARKRYSCDNFKRAMVNEGKVPTVQVASAIASAIQVQEAMKLICGQSIDSGKKIYYQGKNHAFDVMEIPQNPHCGAHTLSYPNVTEVDLSAEHSLRVVLQALSNQYHNDMPITLDLSADRDFVIATNCRLCNANIPFYKPSFRIYDIDTICEDCQAKNCNIEREIFEQQIGKKEISTFNLLETEDKVLDLSLHDLGIPSLHIIAIKDNKENYFYYQLSGDKKILLPNIAHKPN